MGANQPIQAIYNGNFKSFHWKVADGKTSYTPNQPLLVKLPQSDVLAEQYIINLKINDSFFNHVDIYKKRASSNTSSLVNILSAQLLARKQKFVQQCDIIRVRSERIPWRLSNSQNLSIQQGLYILKGACRGFNQLIEHFPQPFSISPEMIGMNIYGTIRVWLNSNFAVNSLTEYQKLSSFQDMITNIITIVEQRLYCKKFPMRNELLNAPHLFTVSGIASKHLNKNRQQSKKIAQEIMQKSKITTMLVQHFNEKSKLQNSRITRDSSSIFKKSMPRSSSSSISDIKHIESIIKGRQKSEYGYHTKNRAENLPIKSPFAVKVNNNPFIEQKITDYLLAQKNNSYAKSNSQQLGNLTKSLNLFQSCLQSNKKSSINSFHNAYSELSFSPQKKNQEFHQKQMSLSDIFPKEKTKKLSLDIINTPVINPKNVTGIIDIKQFYDDKKFRPLSENKQEGFSKKLDDSYQNLSTISTKPLFSSLDASRSLTQSQLGGIRSRNAIHGSRHLYSSQVSGRLK